MKDRYELLIIGAGPSGMAAASTAARCGVDVTLLDEQASPGGQIYRKIDGTDRHEAGYLGKEYWRGRTLVDGFKQSGTTYINNASVWYLDKQREVGVLIEGINHSIHPQRIILATGAQERPMPIPGWQLPGVMSAGAGQILLKSAATVPQDGVVLAGSGPLLLLLAWQYLKAGVKIGALLDTTPSANFSKALHLLPRALFAADYLFKGVQLIAAIKRAGVPTYKNVADLRAEGDATIESVSFRIAGKQSQAVQKIETQTLLLHQGIIPSLRLPIAAGCAVEWSSQQQCWQVCVDDWGQSSIDGIMLGGDGARIIGARAAELQGILTGLQAAHALGKLSTEQRDLEARPIHRSLRRHLSIRPFLDKLYAPEQSFLLPSDDTQVCRCEEVTAGQIRQVARLGCTGPNQTKAFTRCGMGPCQGSQCGSTVAALIADEHKMAMEDVGFYRARPPIKPITLGQLAGLEVTQE